MGEKKPTIKRAIKAKLKGQKLYDPSVFLSPKRIDIAAKTIFARAYLEGNSSKWPEQVYKEHIRAFNNFYEKEPLKNSYADFKNSFINTIESVKSDHNWKHTAPVERKNNYLINGAHRAAASIVLSDKINTIIPKETYEHSWNYEFFGSNRGKISKISEEVLDYMTIEYVSLKKKNIFIAIIFPTAEGLRQEAYEHLVKLGEIVNMKTFKHDEFVGKEVIKQLYFNSKNDEWNYGLDFENANNKAGFCFDGSDDLQVYVIEANLDETTRVKEKQYLRGLWNKDKHSIHITDTAEEANRVVRMFFNENSRRFMKINRKQEFASQKMYDMFNEYMYLAPKDVHEREKIAIEGSAVLDLFNIRAGQDIDYISRDKEIVFRSDNIEKHDEKENKYHSDTIDEIVTNPKYHFYYKGYKFVDILELHKYKQNRSKKGEQKDLNDNELISNFLNTSSTRNVVSSKERKSLPLVSVVIPVYNVEKFLSTCVNSVICQTYKNIEIILVNDGSTDASGRICDEFSEKHNYIKVIHKQNQGLNMARKTGFENSQGERILFIDSDDALHSRAIEVMVDATRGHQSSIVIGGYRNFSSNHEIATMSKIGSPQIVYEKSKDKAIRWLISGAPYRNVFMQTAWMKLYPRQVIANIDWSYSDYRANEDEFMAIQYYKNLTQGVVIVPEELYYYRLNQNSITRSKFKNEFQNRSLDKFETIEKLYQESLESFGEKFEQDILLRFTNQFLGYMEQYMRNGHLDDNVVESYNLYFMPKIEQITKVKNQLDEPYRSQFLILSKNGVFGLVYYFLHQQKNHINNLEHMLAQRDSELAVLRQPGVRLSVRKFAGSIKRRIRRVFKK